MNELVRYAKAISDENRLRMLKLLTEKDICVCEMAEMFPISHSQISRDLKSLYEAGFLKKWNDGKGVVYMADRVTSPRYCQALMDILADSYNDDETMYKLRTRLQKAIEDQVRERSR